MKAENIILHKFKGKFSTNHDVPPGSKGIPTPNVYMTDKVWNEMAPAFAKGLCYIPNATNYLDLWIPITLDGFGSHLEGDALKAFTEHNILIIK